jgi:predicted AAA+ superfamily ATPase
LIPAFSRFLEIASLSSGEMLNYQNIASECGVSAPTVKDYFQILYDTLIGRTLPAYRKRSKRRLIRAPKFYFFDTGIAAYLSKRGRVEPGSELFGHAFEHFIFSEISAHSGYSELFYPVSYWRTSSGFEIDFVLGDSEAAVEVKSSVIIQDRHLKGIRAYKEEYKAKRYIVVSMDPARRKTEDGIEIMPWKDFLEDLWGNNIIA